MPAWLSLRLASNSLGHHVALGNGNLDVTTGLSKSDSESGSSDVPT